MATGSDAKAFKQDMVVSIRYRNDLPPPPMPPKLLDIDTGGLAQYLTTSYASGLARREELNIEVDAEGGMPIDMVGIPGYFLGDESAIMAPEIPPPISSLDPADQALLMTLDQIKTLGAKNNVSFLRKTQYMNSSIGRANDALIRTNPRLRKQDSATGTNQSLAKGDRENIRKHIQKGFDIAYPDSVPFSGPDIKGTPSTAAERDAWRNPVHPDNPKLKPVGLYPILPDFGATTDGMGAWNTIKFDKPPLVPRHNRRDDRIDTSLILAAEDPAQLAAWKARKDAYDKEPEKYDDPGPQAPQIYSLFIPKAPDSTSIMKKVLDEGHPERDNEELLDGLLEASTDGSMRIPFKRERVYKNVQRELVDPHRFMGISLFNADASGSKNSRLRKQGSAAYYYGILARDKLKADRSKIARGISSQSKDDEYIAENIPQQLMILPREVSTAAEKERRLHFQGTSDSAFAEEFEKVRRAAEAELKDQLDAERTDDAEEIVEKNGDKRRESSDVPMADGDVNGTDRNGGEGESDADADPMDED